MAWRIKYEPCFIHIETNRVTKGHNVSGTVLLFDYSSCMEHKTSVLHCNEQMLYKIGNVRFICPWIINTLICCANISPWPSLSHLPACQQWESFYGYRDSFISTCTPAPAQLCLRYQNWGVKQDTFCKLSLDILVIRVRCTCVLHGERWWLHGSETPSSLTKNNTDADPMALFLTLTFLLTGHLLYTVCCFGLIWSNC